MLHCGAVKKHHASLFWFDVTVAIAGEILEVDKPDKLSFTWHVHYKPEAIKEDPGRVTYLLEKEKEAAKLTPIHDGFPADNIVPPLINQVGLQFSVI